jgi:hypothetical protein
MTHSGHPNDPLLWGRADADIIHFRERRSLRLKDKAFLGSRPSGPAKLWLPTSTRASSVPLWSVTKII